MQKNPYLGKFIVFEGLDGSGKSTQTDLLLKRLIKEGFETISFDFPQHGDRSATMVDDYLTGKYGSADQITPYQASIFYASDRFEASFRIKAELEQGKIVVCDRYAASNMAFQGGKIKDSAERKKFYHWVYDLEYNIFKIPKPDINLILKTSPELSIEMADSGKIFNTKKLLRRQSYLGEKNQDIHESDSLLQKRASDCYSEMTREFPQDFIIIDCLVQGKMLPAEIIHEKIWEQVKKII